MCGIAGIVGASDISQLPMLKKMLHAVAYRGPDGSAICRGDNFAFGHTRLAIIDIGSSGNQPMSYLNRYVITYNGEIYNYIEIREKLQGVGYQFLTQSDTEVILAAYAHWRYDCVKHLNGMFAFGIYDVIDDLLFIARDRIGEKPLYYFHGNEYFYFFSEIKQILATGVIEPIPDEKVIAEYLTYQFSLTNKTFFKKVHKLNPGSYGLFKNDAFQEHQYWGLEEIEIDSRISYADAKGKIRELVEDSLAIRMRADVPVSSYLSGGIDSTVIASLAAALVPGVSTFTVTSKNDPIYDESAKAALTAKHIGSNHCEVESTADNIMSRWADSIYYMDEPEVGYSLLSQMLVSNKVAKKTKVVVGGQGGDELFFGYAWYNLLIFQTIFSKISDMPWKERVRICINYIMNSNFKALLRAGFGLFRGAGKTISQRYFVLWREYGCHRYLKPQFRVDNDPISGVSSTLTELRKFEFKYWLQGLLHVEDRSSMASSLEARVPLLDYRIIEYSFRLSPKYMIDGLLNKKIFIDAFADKIPDYIKLDTKKMGYASPITQWLRDSDVESFMVDVFKNANSYIFRFVNFEGFARESMSPRQVWMLISLEIWHLTFIRKERFLGRGISNEDFQISERDAFKT